MVAREREEEGSEADRTREPTSARTGDQKERGKERRASLYQVREGEERARETKREAQREGE